MCGFHLFLTLLIAFKHKHVHLHTPELWGAEEKRSATKVCVEWNVSALVVPVGTLVRFPSLRSICVFVLV
jgi:hypothetical protein